MPPSPYRAALSTSHTKLAAAIQHIRDVVPHATELGSLVEQEIRFELSRFLPAKVGVSQGFVVDSNGKSSKQMDVVLYDRLNTPRIFASEGCQIFPVESTFACGEIKTVLNLQSIKDSYAKCLSYKRLQRDPQISGSPVIRHKFDFFGQESPEWQSIFFCLAVDSTDLGKLADACTAIEAKCSLSAGMRLDSVFVIGRHKPNKDRPNCLLNANKPAVRGVPQDGSIRLLPRPDGFRYTYRATQPWSLFLMLLLPYMVDVPSRPTNMRKYDDGSPY